MKNNKLLGSIFLIVFIDLLGFSLILPLLPYYAKTFQANSLVTGLLVASYAAVQLVGAPVLGRLGAWAPGVFGAIVLAGLSVYAWNTILNHAALPQPYVLVLAEQPVRIDD